MPKQIIEKPMSEQCTMATYEAIADSDLVQYRDYTISDYPNDGANATQMAYALTCKRLFPEGTIIMFSGETDDAYTKGHCYQIQVDTSGIKSWKDITPVSEQRYLDLTGDSGTLDADQYKLVTTYDDLIIRIAGISYRQVGKPQNGIGNYIFTNTYYAQPNGTEEFVAYIITIKTDKTWTSTIKNFLQIGQQTYAPFIEITPSTATNGNLSDDDYTNLTEHDDVYIILNNEYYRKADNQHTTGIISYTHTGWNGTQTQDKSINITVVTKAWSLVVGTLDETPKKDSTNTVTSGGVYNALDKLAQSYEQTEADNAVIIRNGNIVKQMATFTVTGNTEKIWSFPYSYDTGKKPIVWVNSVAEGNSVNNGAAVTSWNEASMTVRSCGADSEITFYAEGWIAK